MKPQKKRYCFLCLDGTTTVVGGRVVDYLRRIYDQGRGLPFDLFLYGHKAHGEFPYKDSGRRAALSESIGGRAFADTFSNPFFGLPKVLWALMRACGRDALFRRLVIHGRAKDGAFVGALFKWICLGRPIVIYDARGDILGELRYFLREKSPAMPRWKTSLLLAEARMREGLALRSASFLFCHSQALYNEIIRNYPFARKLPWALAPSCADETLFRYDPELRHQTRASLQITPEERVLINAGGLQVYQRLEKMVALFSECLKRQNNMRLLIATHSEFRENAELQLAQLLPNDSYRVVSAPHDAVPALMNAADLGLLLLDDDTSNVTRSPVRFAEYICCGLPVAITEGIGDYSAMAREHLLGGIVDLKKPEESARALLRALETCSGDAERRRIADFGRENLSFSRYVPEFRACYEKL